MPETILVVTVKDYVSVVVAVLFIVSVGGFAFRDWIASRRRRR